jgi:hypothetical protein
MEEMKMATEFEKRIVHNLYRNAIAADDAWSDELVAKYGKRAGDERYLVRNQTGEIYKAWRTANDTWRNAHQIVFGY